MEEFTPPIKERETEELLNIVGSEKDWNPRAVSLAYSELKLRGIEPVKVKTSKYLHQKRKRIEKSIKANEGFTILDFIFHFGHTMIVLIFSWELKKDGYLRKAKQQKYFRLFIGGIIFTYVINSMLP